MSTPSSTGSALSMDVDERLIGRCVDGKFVLRELIGRGSCGAVYRAEQVALHRTVAIKVLRWVDDASLAQRFHDEAFAISRLHHPSVVTIYDHGRTDDGLLYIAMEHLRGRSLRALLEAEFPLPLHRSLGIVLQILDALEEAHAAGVIHADLKSDNVIIETLRDGRELAKVIDFGIARLLQGGATTDSSSPPGTGDDPDTGSGEARAWRITGTPGYMAPEVICGQAPGRSADIYAVGVVLHELLTGEQPFAGDSVDEILNCQLTGRVPSLAQRFPRLTVDAQLERILMRALDRDPRVRFVDATSLREALVRVQDDHRDVAVCRVCGARYSVTFRFCAECGTRLTLQQGSAGQARREVVQEKARGEHVFDRGNTEEAIEIMRSAVGMAIRLGDPELIIDCYHALASLLARTGALTPAVSELEEALDLVTGGGDGSSDGPPELWRLLVLLAGLYCGLGRSREALAMGSRALLAARQASSAAGRQAAQALMAQLYAEARKQDAARPVERLWEPASEGKEQEPLCLHERNVQGFDEDKTAPWELVDGPVLK